MKPAAFWDAVARRNCERPFLVPAFARYKGAELSNLLKNWLGATAGLKVLKTDLFEEATGEDQILFETFSRDQVFGVDLSGFVVHRARQRAAAAGARCAFTEADVRALPYADGFFDLILSNSTLDHLPRAEIGAALAELKRVLKPGGRLLLTLDNKANLPLRLTGAVGGLLGAVPFPQEFYGRREVLALLAAQGLAVERSSAIIHFPSPADGLLHLLGRALPASFIGGAAAVLIGLAGRLGRLRTKYYTGWQLAFLAGKPV